jgi:hypothetical protein
VTTGVVATFVVECVLVVGVVVEAVAATVGVVVAVNVTAGGAVSVGAAVVAVTFDSAVNAAAATSLV